MQKAQWCLRPRLGPPLYLGQGSVAFLQGVACEACTLCGIRVNVRLSVCWKHTSVGSARSIERITPAAVAQGSNLLPHRPAAEQAAQALQDAHDTATAAAATAAARAAAPRATVALCPAWGGLRQQPPFLAGSGHANGIGGTQFGHFPARNDVEARSVQIWERVR